MAETLKFTAWSVALCIVVPTVGYALALVPGVLRWTGYHATPRPDGMIARYVMPEHEHPLNGCVFFMAPSDPSTLEVTIGRTKHRIALPVTAPVGDPSPFDFNGDGVEDRIELDMGIRSGTVRVIDGDNGNELFRHRERSVPMLSAAAYALPDLDGDGASELAVYHPREDRSVYDFEMVDRLIDVTSWVTVVQYRD